MENYLSAPLNNLNSIVGQRPSALAIGVGGSCLEIFFSRLSFLFFFLPFSLEDGLAVDKATNQLHAYYFEHFSGFRDIGA